MIQDKLYTPQEVSELLKCSLTFIYDHKQQLGVVRIGKLMRFPESSLRKILNVGMEVKEQMVLQVPPQRGTDTVDEGVRYPSRGKTRPSGKEGRTVEDPGDPFGLRKALRKSAERFEAEKGSLVLL